MSEIPYFVRYKEVTTLDDTDSLYLDDDASDVPKKITYENFKIDISTSPVALNYKQTFLFIGS